jgi:hypothetical protein
MISSFVSTKFKEMSCSKGAREGVEILLVVPQYSSIIGKYKYGQQFGISVHLAAALVLGRRALQLKEQLPSKNAFSLAEHREKHVWILWKMFDLAVSNRDFQVGTRKVSRLTGST